MKNLQKRITLLMFLMLIIAAFGFAQNYAITTTKRSPLQTKEAQGTQEAIEAAAARKSLSTSAVIR